MVVKYFFKTVHIRAQQILVLSRFPSVQRLLWWFFHRCDCSCYLVSSYATFILVYNNCCSVCWQINDIYLLHVNNPCFTESGTFWTNQPNIDKQIRGNKYQLTKTIKYESKIYYINCDCNSFKDFMQCRKCMFKVVT